MIMQIVASIQYQVNTVLPIPIPTLIFLTSKDSLCKGEQCVMIYKTNHRHLPNSEHILMSP